ncbi:UNVERIFIED_CONTAM: hypothetical protein Sindi_0523000, partial [Sesamum indicum]
VFSHPVQVEESIGVLQGVAISKNDPRVSHLLFVDDTLIFAQATEDKILCIKGLLQRFEEVFGLAMNWQKSATIFSKNEDHVARRS